MLKVAYYQGNRLDITDYDPQIHEGKVYCPDGHLMVAKRGAIKTHHYAHRAGEGANCSSSEGKTDWHLWWQARLLPKQIELRLLKPVETKQGVQMVLKIADSVGILGDGKTLSIVEFQSSVMKEDELIFREAFYSRRDLMSEWGLADCPSELTWIFNLNNCDIEIEHTIGDFICFKWLKGTKYMLAARARRFFDLGRRDLIQVFALDKPQSLETKFIGRMVSLERLDEFLFNGILDLKTDDDRRLNKHPLAEYKPSNLAINDSRIGEMVEILEQFYFKKNTKEKSKAFKRKAKEFQSRFA